MTRSNTGVPGRIGWIILLSPSRECCSGGISVSFLDSESCVPAIEETLQGGSCLVWLDGWIETDHISCAEKALADMLSS